MKRFLTLTLLLGGLCLLISSCAPATGYDVDIARENTKRVRYHETGQKEVAKLKAAAIYKVYDSLAQACNDNSMACGMVKAMSARDASDKIASIGTTQYNGPVQRTGVDASVETVDKIANKAGIIGLTVVSSKQADNPGQVTSISAKEGSPVTLDHTLNRTHTAAITGKGDVSLDNKPSDHTSVDDHKDYSTDNSVDNTDNTNNSHDNDYRVTK